MASRTTCAKKFRTGEEIPVSGIYRVVHLAHRLPHEVTLLAGYTFPRCQRCNESVLFEPVRVAPDFESQTIIVLYQLPEIEPDEAA